MCMEEFAKSITRKRKQLGLTKYKLAKMATMPYQTLQNIEKGKSVRIETLLKVVETLGMKMVIVDA